MAQQAMYLTDDRDLPLEDQRALVIFPGGNGDWYVQVTPHHGRGIEGVRICTSGGAATACPGLPNAIAQAYRCMKAASNGGQHEAPPSLEELEAEVKAWRHQHPGQRYAFGEIVEKVEGFGNSAE